MEEAKERISEAVLRHGAGEIAIRLLAAGHEAWFVGGCVRDSLLGLPLKDVDIATNAIPREVADLFEDSRFVGQKFGVSLVRMNGIDYEVATFRKDGAYLDHRHPEHVEYGTLEDDVARRDFTVNALFQHPITGEVRDLVGGVNDLHSRRLRCVGDAQKRFNEDALRLLRAIRFATRFDFKIEQETWNALKALAPTITYVSPERHREELTRILCGPKPSRALRLMDESGLLHFLLPEIEAMKGIEQGKIHHPEGDVFEHTLLVMENIEPKTTINVWAALLHDVGKPPTFVRTEEGKISFYEHQTVGGEMAEAIMRRLRFSNEEIAAVRAVVERHMMFTNVEQMRTSTLRRFLGAPTIEHDLAIHRADCLGSHSGLEYWNFCHEKLEEFSASGEKPVPPPLITGRDLLELGMKPGPDVGRLLKEAQELQMEHTLKDRTAALEWAREAAKGSGKAGRE